MYIKASMENHGSGRGDDLRKSHFMNTRSVCSKYYSSRNCNKRFKNLCFLQTEQKKKGNIEKMQDEIEKLKEQLQVTKSQLEFEHQANLARLSKVIHTK